MRNRKFGVFKKRPFEDRIKRLDLAPEIMALVDQEVSTFRNFTPEYIHDNYKYGPSDLVLRIQGNRTGVMENGERMAESTLIDARCKAVASIVGGLWERGYRDIMDDLDIIIPFSFSDMTTADRQEIPSLTFCKEVGSNNILVPSINNLLGHPELEHIGMVDGPLSSKEDKMCFVGSLTNIYWNDMGMEHNQRLQVANMVGEIDDLVCKINKPMLYDEREFLAVADEVYTHFPNIRGNNTLSTNEDKVELVTQLKYKFQICIDGHVCAWARLPWQLKSHSVPIKIRNPDYGFLEWFYPLLNTSRHCIETNLADLPETFEYLVNNPEYQSDIDRAGSDFVDKYISTDIAQRVFLYTLLCINETQPIYIDDLNEE